ncbi:MAG: ATPase, T2SS/T4P/T4SS family, partial [Planctomycetota bacterium]|nr:ATPase, T2SS/T4P/T4SS family [Planctomycetota bacterium]
MRGTRSPTELGYDPYELKIIHKMLDQPAGLILVAGPVATVKSSTLYAALDGLNDESRKIHTLEDAIEHGIAGVMQSQVFHKLGLDFADPLAAVLRHSPDFIMIGEIRDPRTGNTAIHAGISEQVILATIHAKSAAEAIDSLGQSEMNPKFFAQSFVSVINQRLMRTLCPACKQLFEKKANNVPERLKGRVPVSPDHRFESVGCEECLGDGYQELTCVSEIFKIAPKSSRQSRQVSQQEKSRLSQNNKGCSLSRKRLSHGLFVVSQISKKPKSSHQTSRRVQLKQTNKKGRVTHTSDSAFHKR